MAKEILTKERCRKDLLFENKKSLLKALVYFIVTLFFVISVAFLYICLFSFDIERSGIGFYLGIIGLIILSLYVLFFICLISLSVIRILIRYKKIKEDRFNVTEDYLVCIRQKNPCKLTKIIPVKNYIFYSLIEGTFSGCYYGSMKELVFKQTLPYEASVFNTGIFNYSSPEDKFYLVTLYGKNEKPIYAYNSKIYEMTN